MTKQKIDKNNSFRAATDDLVKTVQVAIEKNEIDKADREWLLHELDEMIRQLKSVQRTPAPASGS